MIPLDHLARKRDFRQLLDRKAPMRLNLEGSYQPALHDARPTAHENPPTTVVS
jgi:hypothetical protein